MIGDTLAPALTAVQMRRSLVDGGKAIVAALAIAPGQSKKKTRRHRPAGPYSL